MYSGQNINGIDARDKSIKLNSIEMRGMGLLPSSILRHPVYVTENNTAFGFLYWPWKTRESSFNIRTYHFC